MQKQLGEFNKQGVQIKVLAFSEVTRLKPYLDLHKWKFDVYADHERKFYQAFGFEKGKTSKILSPQTMIKGLKLMMKGFKMKTTDEDVFQLGGNVLVDADGRIRYIYPSTRPDDRPSVKTLLSEVKKLG